MAKAERFEDLQCWQAARELARMVYAACECKKLAEDLETRAQPKGAALSSMSNIAEGFGRRSSIREFIRFLNFSEGSSIEVKSISYVLEDAGYLPMAVINQLRDQSEKTKSLTIGLIRYLRGRLGS